MVRILDEPIGDAAAINAYLICRAAREAGVKVLLSGMGADELFAGYRKHYACLLAGRYRRLPGVRARRVVRWLRRPATGGNGRRGATARSAGPSASCPSRTCRRRPPSAAATPTTTSAACSELLDPELWPMIDELVEEHADVYRQGPPDDQVNRMCFTDTRLFLPGLNLAYTDRASMAASTEVRVPFVDKRGGVRAAFALPGDRKIVGRRAQGRAQGSGRAVAPQGRSCTARRPCSARRCGHGSGATCQEMVEDLVARGSLVTSGMVDKTAGPFDDRRGPSRRRGLVQGDLAAAHARGVVPAAHSRADGGDRMKQVVQNYRSGELAMLEVPVPACQAGGVLVRTRFSLVSTGTEIDEDRGEPEASLLGKARARPDQVRQVVQSVSQQGLLPTYRKVSSRLDSYTPLGYSLCGEVVEVGADVHDLRVGDVVACAGNAYALHAELNFVPRNLCVPYRPA